MVSSVNPYPPSISYIQQGNASLDYLNLALVVETSRKLQDTTREFVLTYDPKKMYINIQNINISQHNFINTRV